MAILMKNSRLAVTTSYSTIYTCPASTTAVILSLQVANVDGTANADISAQWLDSSNADTPTRIASTISVAADSSINLIAGKLILEAGDALQLLASANSDLEATISLVELT